MLLLSVGSAASSQQPLIHPGTHEPGREFSPNGFFRRVSLRLWQLHTDVSLILLELNLP